MREDQEQLVGHLMRVATIVAMQEKLEPGYRIVINDGPDARTSFDQRIRLISRANRLASPHSRHRRKEVRMAPSLNTGMDIACVFVARIYLKYPSGYFSQQPILLSDKHPLHVHY